MLPLTATAVLTGQLLSAACAAGLNLYATVAIIGLAARAQWIAPLPPDLRGLSHGLVIGSAAALFLAELIIEKLPVIGAVWAGAHSFIRPVATALLTFLAFAGQPLQLALPLALAAGCVSFAAQGIKTGVRVWIASSRRSHAAAWTAAGSLTLDFIAIALALAALLHPSAATGIGTAAILVILAIGPRLWRASTFGARAFLARLVGFFGHPGWKPRERLPHRIRSAVPLPPLGLAQPRGTRAAALGLRGASDYRNGWLVFATAGPSFVFRTLTGARLVPLPEITGVDLRTGPMIDALLAHSARSHFTLFLLKDGPAPEQAVAELLQHHEPA